MSVTFITGNANKAKYFAELVGRHIKHHPVDTPEIQSLDLVEIVGNKARAAYQELKKPVIVEDTSLIINSLGKLPGPFIKWFLEEIGVEKICRLADINKNRSSVASAAFAYFDGDQLKVFKTELNGRVAEHPKGDGGFGWNQIFIPEGSDLTLGQMDDKSFKDHYVKIKPFQQIKDFLAELDKA